VRRTESQAARHRGGGAGCITAKPVLTRAKKAIRISRFVKACRSERRSPSGARRCTSSSTGSSISRVPRFATPRLPTRSFDGRGITRSDQGANGLPEIDYDKVEKVHGMDITFVTLPAGMRRDGTAQGNGHAVPNEQRCGVTEPEACQECWIEKQKRRPKFAYESKPVQRCGRRRRSSASSECADLFPGTGAPG